MFGENIQSLKDNIMFAERYSYDHPYISKSSYLMFKYACKFRYKMVYLEKVQQEPTYIMQTGTILHNAYCFFFDAINYDYLYDLNWANNHGTPYNAVYLYFLSVLETLIPESIMDVRLYTNMKGFAHLEEDHWFSLRTQYKTKDEILRLFKPIALESFYVNHKWRVYGTFDRIDHNGLTDIIIDYKTGKLPKIKTRGMYGGEYVNLSSSKTAEGNFYVFLNLLRKGFDFVKDSDGKYQCVDEFGKVYKVNNEQYAFAYTNDAGNPMVVRKKASIVSIRTIIKTLEEIRKCKKFDKNVNYYLCRNCQFALTECKEDINIDLY